MTVTATTTYSELVGNGLATAFPFTFAAASASEVKVSLAGVVQSGGYTVSLSASGTGGTVTFDTAPVNAAAVLIESDPAFTQNASFANEGSFNPATFDRVHDRLTAYALWLKARVSALFPFSMADAAARAGKYLAFDSLGNGVLSSGTGADAGLRTDLAASTGSTLLGWIQAGVGAILRTVRAKLRETVTPQDFGTLNGVSAAASESAGVELALTAVRNTDDAYFSGAVKLPNGIYRLTDSIALPQSFVRLSGERGALLWGAAGQHVLDASGASFIQSDLHRFHAYGGLNALNVGTAGEIASLNIVEMNAAAYTGTALYFLGGLTASKIIRPYVNGSSSSGSGLHCDGGTNNNNVVADGDFTNVPADVIKVEGLTQGWQFRNLRIENNNGQALASQYNLAAPTGVAILGGWSEASHQYLLTTSGGEDDNFGVLIDGLVSIGSDYGGGFVAPQFSVGAKRIIFGSNIWSQPTTAPLNVFINGVNKNLRVAGSNVWTRDVSTTKRVTAARRTIASAPALTFNLFTVTRGSAAAGNTNQQTIHVRVKLIFTGFNAGPTASFGVFIKDLVIHAAGATITDVVGGTAVEVGTLNGITATFSQGTKTSTASTVQVAIANLNVTAGQENYVSYELEVLNVASAEANGFTLALG